MATVPLADCIFSMTALRERIDDVYHQDENASVEYLLTQCPLSTAALQRIEHVAEKLVEGVRERRLQGGALDAFMQEYDLSSDEGIALMCLAESLLRVPDEKTIHQLIKDKLSDACWEKHLGQSDSWFVNAATWSLMLTGKIIAPNRERSRFLYSTLRRFTEKASGPVVRNVVRQAMKILGKQFVMGRNMDEALQRAQAHEEKGYLYSYDMLGEAARTQTDADTYFKAYERAIVHLAQATEGQDPRHNAGISIKLSALHPRYEFTQRQQVVEVLSEKLLTLAQQAKAAGIGLTVDAEEANRLDLSLDIVEKVFTDESLAGWEGLGVALQSYQKRAFFVIDWLVALARKQQRRLMVRLIKGAYWDSEIKAAQEQGLSGYPVFTRKACTDVSFLACAHKLLQVTDCIYPQFATHNAYSVAAVLEMAGEQQDLEFQCLHGMGDALYDQFAETHLAAIPCRIYAPVGEHEDLLPYLVRRLLENGANSSFVNRIVDEKTPIKDLVKSPLADVSSWVDKAHPDIPLPVYLYPSGRLNAKGVDLSSRRFLTELKAHWDALDKKPLHLGPVIQGKMRLADKAPLVNPANTAEVVGHVTEGSIADMEQAISCARLHQSHWDKRSVDERAHCLEAFAKALEENFSLWLYRLVYEAGKTLPDAVAEVREAIDFCRYYAEQGRQLFSVPQILAGPTGEHNQLSLHGRGVMLCISPWNFPLAIFIGQIAASLVTGNAVVAKPAEQTPLIAIHAVQALHAAGVPAEILHVIPGSGEILAGYAVKQGDIQGVMFTGSTETAHFINQTLAARPGPLLPFIAETGGQNTMIVGSTALPEQVVQDVVVSAFGSAGQRCSALRVLLLQEEIAAKVIEMLKGAMAELQLGSPSLLATDVGPVIDAEAKAMLETYQQKMQAQGACLYEYPMPQGLSVGHYVRPCVLQINRLSELGREIFGPILHVMTFKLAELESLVTDINGLGYGLTLGIHSRIDEQVEFITQRANVGNTYVNRNMIGAVVGVQPFGGEGLSGTGPKAGGPHYLQRLCVERTLTVNTTAAGGNASLMSLNS